jgi:hypothetical protein
MQERWTSGYAQWELDAAQERYGLRFPPDLVALLLDRRPVQGWDWRSDDDGIRWALEQPLQGLLFDVEHNCLWWPEWGERPSTAEARAEIVAAAVHAAPRLIPLIAHRYIPEAPHLAGNPVFSVMQSDVIYYGRDLQDYFRREFSSHIHLEGGIQGAPRRIPFWSDLVDRNC